MFMKYSDVKTAWGILGCETWGFTFKCDESWTVHHGQCVCRDPGCTFSVASVNWRIFYEVEQKKTDTIAHLWFHISA